MHFLLFNYKKKPGSLGLAILPFVRSLVELNSIVAGESYLVSSLLAVVVGLSAAVANIITTNIKTNRLIFTEKNIILPF